MANVTATDAFFDDPRFDTAGVVLGIDGDLVRLKMQRLWSWQTEKYTPETPTYVVGRAQIIGIFRLAGAPDALVEAGLAEPRDGGGYYIKGTEGVIEWLWKKKAAGKKGREAQVKSGAARAHPGHTPGATQGADRVLTGPCDPGSEIRDPEEQREETPAAPAVLALVSPEPARPDPAAALAAHATAEINRATGRSFDPSSKATLKLCRALVREKVTADDVTRVVEHKAAEWLGTSIAGRVCPATLLAADNFARYLDEARAGPPMRAPGGAPIGTAAHPPVSTRITPEDFQ